MKAVHFDSPQLKRLEQAFMKLWPSQVRYACAVALTKTAQDIRDKQRQEMPGRFTTKPGRGKITQRTLRGITINRAEKRQDIDRIYAEVGSRDPWMKLQETGGVKRAQGGHRLGIPSSRIRLTSTGKVKKPDAPRQIFTSRKVYRHEASGGVGSIRGKAKTRIRGQTKKGRQRTKMVEDQVFWWLKKEVRLKPRLGLRETAATHGRRVYGGHFRREFRKALQTMR